MDPTATSATKARAEELFRAGDMVAAADAYRTLAQAQPANAHAQRMLATCLISLKQFDEAVMAGKAAATLQPTDAEARYVVGYAQSAQGKYNDAIEELDAALYLAPNHLAAKQALIYCLMSAGAQVGPHDFRAAEQYFDRAHKLDPANGHAAAALLELYMKTEQKGKAIHFYQGMSDEMRGNSALQPVVQRFEADPNYRTVTRPAPAPSSGAPKSKTLQETSCPACKRPIMSYAAICPHCGTKIRDYGSFAGVDRGPKMEWQEVAYLIVAILWTLQAGYYLFLSLQMKAEGPRMFYMTVNGIFTFIGIGLIFRWEWIMFIAKLVVYLSLFLGSINFIVSLFTSQWVDAGVSFVQLALSGFMVYLINYIGE